ncbi:MAG: hypothetical protein B7X41_14650, partial [Microbacterium sp. 14-71-5]
MDAVYASGDWYLLVGPRAAVALPPDASEALISTLWERVGSGQDDFSGIVDALTAAGGGSFAAIPPFAAIVREGDDARVAVRGQVTARVSAATAHEISGAEVTTWSERFVPGMTGGTLVLQEDGDADVSL